MSMIVHALGVKLRASVFYLHQSSFILFINIIFIYIIAFLFLILEATQNYVKPQPKSFRRTIKFNIAIHSLWLSLLLKKFILFCVSFKLYTFLSIACRKSGHERECHIHKVLGDSSADFKLIFFHCLAFVAYFRHEMNKYPSVCRELSHVPLNNREQTNIVLYELNTSFYKPLQ